MVDDAYRVFLLRATSWFRPTRTASDPIWRTPRVVMILTDLERWESSGPPGEAEEYHMKVTKTDPGVVYILVFKLHPRLPSCAPSRYA